MTFAPSVSRVIAIHTYAHCQKKNTHTHMRKVFAGQRLNAHGHGTLALPGGHLELYESWENCTIRETLEETGLVLRPDSVKFGYVTNDVMMCPDGDGGGRHYVTIFMMGECDDANARPINMEPKKCRGWESYSWDELRGIAEKGGRAAAELARGALSGDSSSSAMVSGDVSANDIGARREGRSPENDDNRNNNENNNDEDDQVNANDGRHDVHSHRSPPMMLFGPLLKLVENAPRRVVDFINNTK